MTNKDPAKRPNIKDIIQSDDFFYFIADRKHSNQTIANLRDELGPLKFGEAPFETGDLTFYRVKESNGNIYLGETMLMKK